MTITDRKSDIVDVDRRVQLHCESDAIRRQVGLKKWLGSVKSGFEITKNKIVSLVDREAHIYESFLTDSSRVRFLVKSII